LSVTKGKRKFDRLVVKFGGTSLTDGSSISRAADSVIKKAGKGAQMAVVVSAMGKTTDLLISAAYEACGNAVSADELDDILAMGERTSARIFAAAIGARGKDSRYIDPCDADWPIVTDNTFNNAKPVPHACAQIVKTGIKPLLERGVVVVVPGFIGKTKRGEITTMGRGGSDVTALILARSLPADQVILVTDVEGIMSADPKIIKAPQKLREIPMDALVGIADSGTKFIHKKALRYTSPHIDIKVISNSSADLDSEGTLIRGNFPSNIVVEPYPEPVMAVTVVGKLASESPRTLLEILGEVGKAGAPILGMSANHDSLILYLPINVAETLLESLHSIVVRDERALALAVRKDLAFVRVKGLGLEETPGIISSISKALNSVGVNIYGIFTIASSIQMFVDTKDKEKAIRLIEETVRANAN